MVNVKLLELGMTPADTKTVCVNTTVPVHPATSPLFHAVYLTVPDAVAVAADSVAESWTAVPGLTAVALRSVEIAGDALTWMINPLVTGLV